MDSLAPLPEANVATVEKKEDDKFTFDKISVKNYFIEKYRSKQKNLKHSMKIYKS